MIFSEDKILLKYEIKIYIVKIETFTVIIALFLKSQFLQGY